MCNLTDENLNRTIDSILSCIKKAVSDSPHKQQDKQNQKDQSETAARIISPPRTVGPGGQRANEQDEHNDEYYGSNDFPPFLFKGI
jgi:hypothetical protein